MAEKTLLESFWAVARALRHLSRESLAPLEISPSQSRALSVLMRHGPLRLGELSAHLHIAPRSATEVVDGLEEQGLLQRTPDPQDRRATVVSLTGDGESLGASIRAAQAEQARHFFGALSEDERATLAEILAKLVR